VEKIGVGSSKTLRNIARHHKAEDRDLNTTQFAAQSIRKCNTSLGYICWNFSNSSTNCL